MQALTHEHVEEQFSLKGWTLLGRYSRNITSMKATCPKGHHTTISWCNLKKGQGCKHCAGNVRFSYDQVKEHFEQHGCKLLASKYKNNQDLLKFRCDCGCVSEVGFGDFKRGVRCKFCKGNRIAQGLRTPIEEVRSFFEKHECTLLAKDYKDNRTKMPYICKCGQVAEVTYSNFQKCPNCWECGKEKKSGSKCHLWNPDREAVKRNKKYRKICGNILARALNGTRKSDHTYRLLGYHSRDLQEHIRNHPKYQGEDGMQVDHIFPIKAFMDYGIYNLGIINTLENLQPLYGKGNQEKADKYDRDKFEKWLESHKLVLTE